MALECATPVEICALRATRLDDTGAPAEPPKNVYVVRDIIQLQYTPNWIDGAERELLGGCGGCIIAQKTDEDQFRRFDLELQAGRWEPGLLEILTGSAVIASGADLVGGHWPVKEGCGVEPQRVAIEMWAKRWLDTEEQDPIYPWIHYLWTSVRWRLGQNTAQADFSPTVLTGKSRANSAWGHGPFPGQPEAASGHGLWWFDQGDLPVATCDYSSVAATTT